MLYTGGTSGVPKGNDVSVKFPGKFLNHVGVVRKVNMDAKVIFNTMKAMDIGEKGNIHLVAGPMYHSAPLTLAGT